MMASYVYFKCFNEMMFLNNNEKKKKANAISYEIDEFIWGRKDFVTDCPYGFDSLQ